MQNSHWFKESCLHNPENCVNRRSDRCDNPVSDCLLFEKLQDDCREDTKEMEDENG
jgi:hypothetical protein